MLHCLQQGQTATLPLDVQASCNGSQHFRNQLVTTACRDYDGELMLLFTTAKKEPCIYARVCKQFLEHAL